MENNERDRKLDQWLNEALSQYGAAEPRLGLEQRILTHVRAEEQARAGRRTWWRWMPAFAAIAAVLVVMVAVKPYWEEKATRTAAKETSAGLRDKEAPAAKSAAISAELQAGKQPQPERAPRVSTNKLPGAEANENIPAKRKFSAQAPGELSQQPQVAEDAAVKKDLRQTLLAKQEELARQTALHSATKLVSSGKAAGVIGGTAPAAQVAAVPQPASAPARDYVLPQPETIQVQSVVAPAPMQRGVMAPDQLPAQTEGSAQVRSVQAKPAMNATVMGNTMEVMGVTLRTDAITVQPRQVQPFPTPMPLSKQEMLMLAASKELKQTPSTNDKKETEINPIKIEKIEIAPLPGPEK